MTVKPQVYLRHAVLCCDILSCDEPRRMHLPLYDVQRHLACSCGQAPIHDDWRRLPGFRMALRLALWRRWCRTKEGPGAPEKDRHYDNEVRCVLHLSSPKPGHPKSCRIIRRRVNALVRLRPRICACAPACQWLLRLRARALLCLNARALAPA